MVSRKIGIIFDFSVSTQSNIISRNNKIKSITFCVFRYIFVLRENKIIVLRIIAEPIRSEQSQSIGNFGFVSDFPRFHLELHAFVLDNFAFAFFRIIQWMINVGWIRATRKKESE